MATAAVALRARIDACNADTAPRLLPKVTGEQARVQLQRVTLESTAIEVVAARGPPLNVQELASRVDGTRAQYPEKLTRNAHLLLLYLLPFPVAYALPLDLVVRSSFNVIYSL